MSFFTFLSSVNFQGPKSIPEHWDHSAVPDTGFKVRDWRCPGLGRRVLLDTGKCEQTALRPSPPRGEREVGFLLDLGDFTQGWLWPEG